MLVVRRLGRIQIMSKTTPSARTKRYMEGLGYMVGTVERYNHVTQRRHDLFGFFDLIAVRADEIIGLQVTSTNNMSARVKKIWEECDDSARSWIAAGGIIVVQGWSKKQVKRHSPRETWQHRSVQITLEDGLLRQYPWAEPEKGGGTPGPAPP